MKTHVLKIFPGSEAETYFVEKYMPVCKDEVVCRLGSVYGMDWNEYEITDADFHRCQELLKESE